MATTARATPPARRATATSPTPAINRGATARSAATSPRVSSSLAPTRRASLKSTTSDPVSASLKQETEQKEQLLVQVQDKEQTIATLSTENANLTSALQAAESRLNELYADQSRAEVDLAQRIEISENLRAQVRELEKEKREVQRRYNEQTSTFEAERQAFYDNEQHLKSRISSLSQARKQVERPPQPETIDTESIIEVEEEEVPQEPEPPQQAMDDPESEPAEMTALRLELSTLSTSYTSLQNTLVLLQTQLVDLKRVNHELQEENESYMILLREKTLSGQFDVMKQMGGSVSEEETDDDENDDDEGASVERGSLRSAPRSVLDKVEEEEDGAEETLEQQLERSLARPRDTDSPSSSRGFGRPTRKRTGSQSHSPQIRGETLADLPITGPGLDLAAELGRAENKDILDGNIVEDQDRSVLNGKKRSKKSSSGRKEMGLPGIEPSGSMSDIDVLKNEVKSLKDANKALSLYASKIIDRIISQEGFEHVLAVDYEKEPPKSPLTAGPALTTFPASLPPKPRPQSVIVARSTSTPGTPAFTGLSPSMPPPKLGTPPPATAKAQRRSLSFDWKSFSLFSGEKKPENPSLRPLTLKPGASPVTGARKLETHEDDNDRRERERLNATMKLMGIQPQPSPVIPPSVTPPVVASVPSTPSRRFSFFGRAPAALPAPPPESSDSASMHSNGTGSSGFVGLGIGPPSLTQDVLEHAEAENSLAALDAHERTLSAEIAKGSSGGFTEIARRQPGSRRARRSAAGSDNKSNGSTVWSAGEDDD
ncbi:hypothetical protein MIND_00494900 [Mycena indigotica]|uniref:Uncharacterized protein n=1 Tax=Mycena indigotica TaxID=2126181 RepID=A0A8H6W5Z2_9AGAR|nr:uncharacterized protein MIND_00494900 [Mycena indigotica]KAF7307019.1 hypothetical protein MIND_00494900 [Mycena indigotica]